MSYRLIGIQIAKEDGRAVPYTPEGVKHALYRFRSGDRDDEGERSDWKPATNKIARPISLGAGIGGIIFRAPATLK